MMPAHSDQGLTDVVFLFSSHRYVAELEEQEWSVTAESNALCFGSNIIYEEHNGKKVAVGIERAPYPGEHTGFFQANACAALT